MYNYGTSPIALKTDSREYLFDGAKDGFPSVYTLSYIGIEYANSKSNIFRTGALVFEEAEREDIFAALNAPDWKDTYWSEADIENMLLRPTVDVLNRMLTVKDLITIERIRGKMTHFRNVGIERPSERVVDLVNTRYAEIQRGILRSKSVVAPADAGINKTAIENEELKEQNKTLESQMAKLQEQMAALMQQMGAPAIAVEGESTPKRPGRKPKAV